MKKATIYLADGFEDIEALATRDVLLRGGVEVTTVTVNEDPLVTTSHQLQLFADATLEELSQSSDYHEDMMIFPGGMPGAENLGKCRTLTDRMNRHYANGGYVAAICAAPALVLSHLKGISGATFTCYDGFEEMLTAKGARFERRPCVISDRIVTGRGPGHTLEFALSLLTLLEGDDVAARVAADMTLPCL